MASPTFLDLPPEIRLQIYEFAICHPRIELYLDAEEPGRQTVCLPSPTEGRRFRKFPFRFKKATSRRRMALLRVCKLIRSEILLVWYRRTEWVVSTNLRAWGCSSPDGFEYKNPLFWVKGNPVNQAILRRIRHMTLNLSLPMTEGDHRLSLQALGRFLDDCIQCDTLKFGIETHMDHPATWTKELRQLCATKDLKAPVEIVIARVPQILHMLPIEEMGTDVLWHNITSKFANRCVPGTPNYFADKEKGYLQSRNPFKIQYYRGLFMKDGT